MPAQTSIAVIDIGKTNAKVVLIDAASGTQVESRQTPNRVVTDGPYPHLDVDGLWAFITTSLRELHATHGISAISITTHGATAALVAGSELTLPVLDYEHDGPEELAAEYARHRPAFSETYSPRLPNGLNLGAQLFWLSRRHGQAFHRVTAVLTYPQYWAWRLTGVLASEVTSLGCHTDLWAPDRGAFSSLVSEMNWQGLFPPVRPANSAFGHVSAEVAKATGLEADTPVTCGIHDSNASLLPHLAGREPPFTVISSGTWTICMTVGGNTAGLDAARDSLANVDYLGRPVPTARFMGGREFDLLGAPTEVPTAAEIERVIAQDIQVLPGIVPNVGPFPHGSGGWTEPPESLSAGERAAAVALYLALVTQAALRLCGIGREIVLEGPFARNELYGAALGQLTGVPVLASADATGTSLGAAMLVGSMGGSALQARTIAPLSIPGLSRYRAEWLERVAAAT